MNDYKFGNYIYDLRKKYGISQSELAEILGVTNKAVSKWENGKTKPKIDILRKMASYFKISVDDLLIIREAKKMEVSKIVITGGPCAGKSTARTETVEEAAVLDDKLISAWTGHPHLRIINNAFDFENKMKRLIAEISAFLGEPEPFEIERKFLIQYPDISWLESAPNCQRIEIIQTYLAAKDGAEVRVRQRGMNGNYIYFQTTKRNVSDLKRVEIERRLSKDEYLTLLMDADSTKRQIRKTRYCLTFENQYFEIDVYPFWTDKAIVEIELSDENVEIVFPEQIKVIKEVTDDDAYKNASLAAIEFK